MTLFDPQENINGFDFPKSLVITDKSPERISHFNWGLIPTWSKDECIKNYTLNAKLESINDKPAFRDATHNRCLVIANGVYEWQWHNSNGKNKTKYTIGIENDNLFAFAGLYSKWVNTNGEVKNTFTILTTTANDLMANIHNTKKRMPIILKQENEYHWLNHAPINTFANPYQVKLIATKAEQNLLF